MNTLVDSREQSILFLQATLRGVDAKNPQLDHNDLLLFRIIINSLMHIKSDSSKLSKDEMTAVERKAISHIADVLSRNGLQKDGVPEILAIAQSLYILTHGYDAFIEACAANPEIDDFNLSKQERIVLIHLANGTSTKDIASRMGLSVKTVEYYRQMVIKKLGMDSSSMHRSVAIAHFAISRGLIQSIDCARASAKNS